MPARSWRTTVAGDAVTYPNSRFEQYMNFRGSFNGHGPPASKAPGCHLPRTLKVFTEGLHFFAICQIFIQQKTHCTWGGHFRSTNFSAEQQAVLGHKWKFNFT